MCINVVMSSDFEQVTSTDALTVEDIYKLMNSCDYWDAVPCGTGYISLSIYIDEE